MSHPAYKPPLRFVLKLKLQKGGIFAGHYSTHTSPLCNPALIDLAFMSLLSQLLDFVSCGGAPTLADTSVLITKNFPHKCEVKT